MSAERQERYVKAIEDAYWSHGFKWEGPAADAVMALADAEISHAVSPWKGAVERGTSERAELTKRLGEARDEIERLNGELDAANARQKHSWDLARQAQRKVFELRESLDATNDRAADAQQKVIDMQGTIDSLRDELGQYKYADGCESDRLSEQLANAREMAALWEGRYRSGVETYRDVTDAHRAERERAQCAESENEALRAELERHKARYRGALRGAKEAGERYRAKIADVEAKHDALARELEGARRALRFETTQLAAEKAHAARLRQRCAEAEEENARGRTVRTALREGRERLSAELSEARDEIRRLELYLS